MKNRILIFLTITTLAVSACGANRNASQSPQTIAGKKISIVEGVWERPSAGEIKLFEVEKGKLKKIASSFLDAEKRFYFAFKVPAEGFYVIGTSDVGQSNNYVFYFKPGDALELAVNADNYELVGVNTPENVELARWHDWVLPLERRSIYSRTEEGSFSSYEDFFPLLEQKLAAGYQPVATANPVFDAAYGHFRETNLMSIAVNMLVTPRTKHPAAEDMIDYYKNLAVENVADARLMKFPYALDLLRSYPLVYGTIHKNSDSKPANGLYGSLDFMLSKIGDDELKGEFLLANAGGVKTYEGYMDFDDKYAGYFVTPDQQERFKKLLRNIPIPEAAPAVDFRFADKDGNMVALSDFKGKVVYIDVWATWCGPCKAQIPHLKKLEEEFHGNPDIVFMSVSTDKSADHQKWLDMVKSENLGGVQLFAGDRASTDISGPYKISGIPRFILVGKDGNLINIDAPRPSSSEIRPMLEKALK